MNIGKKIRKILSIFIIILLLYTITSYPIKRIGKNLNERSDYIIISKISPSAYNDTNAFSINGDDEFDSLVLTNSWDGNGSQTDPYIIENLNITTSNDFEILINISNTKVYFKIKDCLLVGGNQGISFSNVTNGNVKNNTICGQVGTGINDGSGLGIFLGNSQFCFIENNTIFNAVTSMYVFSGNCTIKENIIYDNDDDGITCDTIGNNTFVNNIIFDNGKVISPDDGYGIRFRDSAENNITGNIIYGNFKSGLYMANAGSSVIDENTIYNNFHGIELAAPNNNCNITGNLIYNNTQLGISITGSNQNIYENTIYLHTDYGIRIMSGTNNRIISNNFIDNTLGSTFSQATEDESGNIFNYNFWSDWTTPDEDKNEITDNPYDIGGTSNNNDPNPKTIAYSTDKIHLLTKPQISYPNDNFRYYSDLINITWGPSSDTFEHNVNYSVYYSHDGGYNWIEIITGISETNYVWDSSIVDNGVEYKIQVKTFCDEGLYTEDITDIFTISDHALTIPTIHYPNGGEVLSGQVNVDWNITFCSWEHNKTYTTYYSADGVNWVEMTTDPYWDTSFLLDGTNYTIKVVATCTGGQISSDVSDGVFTIGTQAIPSSYPSLIIIFCFFGISYVVLKMRKRFRFQI